MARSGGSNDLMNVYARSYAVAHGCPRLRAHHGHHPSTGYVSNNYSAVSRLLCPRGEAEGYPHEALLACRRTGAMSPQLTPLLLSPPKASAVYDTGSRRTGPALPDVLRKTTIGAKATPRSNGVLPALLGQPLGVNITATDYRRPARRDPRQWMPCPSRPISVPQQGGKTLPVPPLGSQRGSGFSREVPGGLDTAGLLVVGHAMPLVSRGLQRPRRTQAGPLGQRSAGRKAGASMATSPPPLEHAPNPLPSPEEPSWFTGNHGQYVRPPPDAVPHSTSPVFDLDGETHGGHPAPAPQDQQPPHLAVEHHRPPPGVAPPAPGVPSPGFSGDPPDP